MDNKHTVSLCMIVKNEEEVLGRCLNGIKDFVDEIIIVDTGSSDTTKIVAQKFTDKIYDFEWVNDFSAARNFAFSKATKEYIMWLDADDVIEPQTLIELIRLKPNLNKDTYMMKYLIPINEKNKFTYYRERIMKNCTLAHWQGVVHECIVPFGAISYIDSPVIHKKEKVLQTDRNLKLYKYTLKKRPLTPREKYYYGRELYEHKKFKEAIKVLKQFVKNPTCLDNAIDAYLIIANSYKELGLFNKQIEILTKILEKSVPNAQVCCNFGDYFLLMRKYEIANFWYLQALKREKQKHGVAFENDIFYGYYPSLQLCVSHYNLGDVKNAIYYNEKASEFYESDVVVKNREFLNKLL